MRRLLSVLILAMLLLAIGACGDDDDDDGNGEPADEATTPAGAPDDGNGDSNGDGGGDGNGDDATAPAGGDEPSGEPIRLGALLPLSGAIASLGVEGERGIDLAVKLINEDGGVLGRPLEVVYKDDQATTDGNIQRVRELADEGVFLTFGYVSSAQCVGTAPIAEQLGVIMMSSYCQTNRMIGEDFNENFFRATSSAEMLTRAGAQAVLEMEGPIDQWASISPDYEYGHNVWTVFRNQMEILNEDFAVAGEAWPPFQSPTFTDYITQVNDTEAEAIFTALFAGDLLNMMQQSGPFDFFQDRVVLLLGGDLDAIRPLADAGALPTNAVAIWDSVLYYHEAFDNPTNEEFVEAFQEEYGDFPIGYNATTFASVYAYAAAIEEAGTDDPEAVKEALEGLTWDTPFGPGTIRADDHQAIFENLAVFRIDPIDEDPGFEITEWVLISGEDVSSPPHPGEPGEFDIE